MSDGFIVVDRRGGKRVADVMPTTESASAHLWLGRPGAEVLTRGVVREHAEQSANDSYDRMVAPPCPACGTPVADKDYERHAYEAHDVNDAVRPYGRPDSRECVIQAGSPALLEPKVARWRQRHPGCDLALLGEGKEQRGKHTFYWQRYTVVGSNGKPAA